MHPAHALCKAIGRRDGSIKAASRSIRKIAAAARRFPLPLAYTWLSICSQKAVLMISESRTRRQDSRLMLTSLSCYMQACIHTSPQLAIIQVCRRASKALQTTQVGAKGYWFSVKKRRRLHLRRLEVLVEENLRLQLRAYNRTGSPRFRQPSVQLCASAPAERCSGAAASALPLCAGPGASPPPLPLKSPWQICDRLLNRILLF